MNCLPVLFARASLKLNSESTKKELEKELDVVNQIQGKLGGLKVTDTAATAAADAQIAKEKAEKEAEGARLAEEREDKRIADEQAAAEVAAEVAAAAAKPKTNQNKPVPNADGTCLGPSKKTFRQGDGGRDYSIYINYFQRLDWEVPKRELSDVFYLYNIETLAEFKALGVPQPRTGLASLIDDWIAGDQRKKDVVAKYGTIENWNTKFVTNLNCVFSGSKNFNANLSQWDVSNITTLEKGKFFIANFHCQLLI
jgi:hypothetical protein